MKITIFKEKLKVPKVIIFKKIRSWDVEVEYKFVKMLNSKVAKYEHDYISTRTGELIEKNIRYLEEFNYIGKALYNEQINGIESKAYGFKY